MWTTLRCISFVQPFKKACSYTCWTFYCVSSQIIIRWQSVLWCSSSHWFESLLALFLLSLPSFAGLASYKWRTVFCFVLDLFIYLRQREGRGERTPSQLQGEWGAQVGAWSQHPEIMTRTQTKSQTLNQLCHPSPAKVFRWSGPIFCGALWVKIKRS